MSYCYFIKSSIRRPAVMMANLTWLMVGLCATFALSSDPLEDPNLFEGDMILTDDQKTQFLYGEANYQIPLAATKVNLWPRTIPYSMDSSIASSSRAMKAINDAIADYQRYTCLRFKRRTKEAGYMHFYQGRGCSSPVGYYRRVNRISLASGCWYKGIVMHEIAHSLGFYHEQSRPDRDNHVTIIWNNIAKGMEYNFRKQSASNIDSMNVPYDYSSVMHYGKSAFGSGRLTIQTKDPAKQDVIGNRAGFSELDIKQMKLLYKCSGGQVTTQKPTRPPTQPPTTSACVDIHAGSCPRWQKAGYCTDKRYKAYMERNCRKSCGICGGGQVTTQKPTRPPTQPPTTSACVDIHAGSCPRWQKAGYCTDKRYKAYMERNCRKSCGICGGGQVTTQKPTRPPTQPPTTSACVDIHAGSCPRWQKAGYCTDKRYKAYMERNCRKSCGICGGGQVTTQKPTRPPTQPPTTSACKDVYPRHCPSWKSKGYCTKYLSYMRRNCKSTCGFCGGAVTTQGPTRGPTTQRPTRGPTQGPQPSTCGKPEVAQSRVISGIDARKGSWPWQILMLYNGRTMCGGSIIAPQWVVTAAHCVSGREANARYFKVRVGEHNTGTTSDGQHTDMAVERIISHPQYTATTINNDIALMKLSSPIMFGKYVKPVCLPKQDDDVAAGTQCFITGWGKIKHPGSMHHTLQQGEMPVVSNTDCTNLNTRKLGIKITDQMLCAGHGGSTRVSGCHGDSGGPFVCQTGANGSWELHGAVSWGSGRCDATQGYTVFARVAMFRSWIDQQMSRY